MALLYSLALGSYGTQPLPEPRLMEMLSSLLFLAENYHNAVELVDWKGVEVLLFMTCLPHLTAPVRASVIVLLANLVSTPGGWVRSLAGLLCFFPRLSSPVFIPPRRPCASLTCHSPEPGTLHMNHNPSTCQNPQH